VVVTLVVVFRASRSNRTAADYYAAGRSFTGPQNGVAIAGDYLSAASFLGIAGAIAVNGYDGFLYSIGFLVAWLVALLLVAELLRNTGKFTMGDVLSFRMRQRPVRAAAATSTLVVSFFYLLAQMAGAGALIALLLQIPNSNTFGQGIVIAIVGVLMIVYLSLGLALVLGTAGLPHILMRFYTVPSAKEARRSVVWAIWLIGIFYLFSLVLGYGAAALVSGGAQRIATAPGGTNSAAPLLAYELGGEVVLGIISAIAFATILAVVAGLTITASASFAHDV